jgi:ribosome-associated translation inhibitor RaiA
VLFARLALTMGADPALERPAEVKASVDVSGRHVRAHVAAPTMPEAIDRMADRIRRGIRRLHEKPGHDGHDRREE